MSEHSDDSLRNQTDPISRRATLSAAKKAWLEKRIRGDNNNQQPQSSIPRLANYDHVPLSFAQERLWFLSQYEPSSSNAYIIPLAVRIDGPIDPSILERALQLVVERHASLRTTFHAHNGVPFQRVAPQMTLNVPVLALEVADDSDETAVLQLVLDQLVPLLQLPFDLEHGPLLRATLLRLAAESHVLLLICHHIISDGWSMGVLLRDFASFLGALRTNTAPDLAPLLVQAPDVAVWQRQRLQGQYLATLQDFWKNQLADLEPLNLPTDFGRPAQQSYRGATLSFQLPSALSHQLQVMAQQQNVTTFMLMFAAFQAFLARLSGQHDLAIGSVLASRADTELDPVIGFLVNTWTLRNQIDLAQPLATLLPGVRSTILAAFEHRDLPFEQVVQLVQPERDLSRSPLFQVMMTYQNMPQRQMQWGDVTLTPISLPSTVAKFDLTLALSETPEGFRGVIEYSSDLFRRSTIATMVTRWESFLQGVVADFTTPLARLPLVLPAERTLLLDTLNATTTAYPSDQTVASLFAEQAQMWPQQIALSFGEHSLTYHALEQRANQVAHHLQMLGVGPEHVVGLCVERSLELVVAILAILKAGAAYAPLDPSYPVERLEWMLTDLQPTVLIGQQRLLDRLPSIECSVVVLETLVEQLAAYPTTAPTVQISPDNMAYVMYTSGSTGRPKGIMINQRNIVRLVRNTNYAEFGPAQVGLLLATVAFDASTFEIWGCLLNGGRLVIAPPQQLGLDELGQLLEREQITTLWLTAGLFHQMVDHALDRLGSLRQLLAGGDRLSPVHVQKVLEHWPNCRVINGYGPTENTTFSCCQQLTAMTDLAQGVPIGQPIANTTAYILDPLLQLVPIGVVGELYLGGAGLARGYLNRPDQTAAAFIPNPLSQTAGERLYRSGDLARYRDDGTIEFIGRRDQQIKLRGYRIELEEIVGVVLAQPQVDDAVVVVREDREGDQRLVAYLVGDNPAIDLIEQAVQRHLPSYMLPSAYIVLDALPLTPNGKVDRRRLPAPSYATIANDDPPQTDFERAIAAIWAEVLAVPTIQRQTNFFQVGGHSLLATQVVARVRELLPTLDLPVRRLFELPTLAAFVASLDPTPHEAAVVVLPALVPQPRPEHLPVSFAQERLWFLNQLDPTSNQAYTIPLAVRIVGDLPPMVVQAALQQLVDRHSSLRTSFYALDGQPYQRIAPTLALALSLHDLRGRSEADVHAAIQAAIAEPFDLERGPLLRVTLLREADNRHVMVLTLHHSITDGWSMELLLREFAQALAAARLGEPARFAPLAVDVVDVVLWQRAVLSGERLAQLQGYWQTQLRGVAPLALPTDYPQPAVQQFAGATLRVTIPTAVVEQLRILGQSHGATLFMVLMAAYQAWLARLSGQRDIAVGTPIAGRTQAEMEGLIGFFANTLVVRSDVQRDLGFTTLLEQVRTTLLAGYSQQELPFEQMVQLVQPERDLSRSPLFQAMLTLHHAQPTSMDWGAIALEPIDLAGTVAKFDLSLGLVETTSGLVATFEYSTALFNHTTIERWAGHWQTFLTAIAANPAQSIGELALLTKAERAQVLVGWNQTRTIYPPTQGLHHAIEAQVAQHPTAIALRYEDRMLSYAELNARANQLAHRLIDLGVRPDTLVAICAERSIEMVIGLLGVLKAGGAYVPLDASYPLDRLEFMLADAQPLVLLTALTATQTNPELQRLIESQACPQLDLMQWQLLADQPTYNPAVAIEGHNLAYMIYTSGSTGKPKGALNQHDAIINRLLWMQAEYRLTAADRVLQKTPFSFDVSVWEFFWPLLVGAQLVLARPEGHKDPAYLAEIIQAEQITTVHFVPSMLRLFLGHQQARLCTSLRRTICSGEALPADVAQQFLRQLPQSGLHNLYGPTEAAVDVSYWACLPDATASSVPIGRPVANTQLYLLDQALQPVPIGCFGELYIGGLQVGRGYHNRPNLTAERFVPDPFSPIAGARLYRTGDLARWRADGNIEYGGRIDHQVKVRGLRIELGEIEQQLLALPEITDAVVMLREDQPGDQRLVAYVVCSNEMLLVDMVRQRLAQHLPEFMLPNALVLMDALPLSPNGKLDRSRLPVPSYAEPLLDAEPPQTELEQAIAEIWASVLGVSTIQRQSNFFQLGGHSLLATQVVARVRELLPQIDLPLRRLFELPTLAAFAASLQADSSDSLAPVLPALIPQPTPEHIPLSFAQERLWFLSQLDAESSQAYTIPMAVRIVGDLPPMVVQSALQQLVDRHASLRTSFYALDGQPYQRIAPTLTLGLALHDLRGRSEADVYALIQTAIAEPFDLEHGPLLRAMLLREADDRHVLVLILHHTITDGWSMELLVRELAQALAAARVGEVARFAPLAVDVVDVVLWQRAVLSGERLTRLQTYWQQQLRDVAPLALPTDYPRPAVQQFAGATVGVMIPQVVVTKLRLLGQAHGATLFMVLMAAYQAWLARLSGQRDIAVGTPIAGRTQAGMDELIGFFANTLVVRSAVARDMAFTTLLEQVRETLLAGYSHQELPFEQVVQVVQPERDLSRSPLFQAMLTLQHAPQSSLDWGEIALEPISLTGTIAKFDLTLGLLETPQGLIGSFEYSTMLFAATTIERWATHWQTFLTALADDPALAVGRLSLLQPAEQAAIVQRQAPTLAVTGPTTLAEALMQQAAATPTAIAVQTEGSVWTYAQLNTAANQLAWELRELGVGPEMVVGMYLNRTPLLLVTLLAILKAGGAYLPLDPQHPIERVTWMLADSQALVVVTEQHLSARLNASPCQVLDIETAWLRITAENSPSAPPLSSTAANLAYVIYTSGSTGVPKGVAIPQHTVLALLASMREQISMGVGDVLVALSTMAFDISVVDVFLPLTRGATIYLVTSDVARDPVLLRDVLERQPIRLVQATPATWRLLISAGWQGDPTLTAIAGGEALHADLAAAIRMRSNALWNMYGPTETTVYATRALIANDDISLGWGLDNVRLYVLDQAGQVVPLGVAGELYIGGSGIARGYLGQPSLTAERFVPDPWSGEAGARLYRTGDLVRQRADGRFVYDGRIDHQVKVRGFRIELGEIEHRVLALPVVTDAVVVVREDQPGDQRLVAYVVAPHAALTLDAVRQQLAQHLPEYMLPNALVVLERMPLSPNGKVDRRRLPAPSYEPLTSDDPPQTELEQLVATIWAEVLGVPSVQRHANFFQLGGHSLLATQVVARVRDLLPTVEVPLRRLFELPTLAAFAASLDSTPHEAAMVLPALVRQPTPEHIPLSFAQERLWFLNQLDAASSQAYTIPMAVRIVGAVPPTVVQAALQQVVDRHASLRTSFYAIDGQPYQRIAAQVQLDVPVQDVDGWSEAAVAAVLARAIAEPFDLEQGPLLRAMLLREAADRHILVLTVHHTITDGQSMEILLRELAQALAAARQGAVVAFAPLAVDVVDVVVWQRAVLRGERLTRLQTYWQQQLRDVAPLALPTDYPRPAVQQFAGATVAVTIAADVVTKLRELGQAHGATLFMVLMAAYQAWLARLSGQRDIAVGTPIAGRTQAGMEGLIGFFANTLVVRNAVAWDDGFTTLLGQVRETLLAGYSHQELPFEQVVQVVQPERDLSRSPLFQTLLTVQHAQPTSLDWGAIQLEPIRLAGTIAKFDLSLGLVETPQGLVGGFEYSTALFAETTIERWASHWQTFLTALAAQPTHPLGQLTLLTSAERTHVVQGWNQTHVDYPQVRALHHLIEAQVARTPTAIALHYEDQVLSYGALNARANQVAQRLIALGVQPDDLVAICAERSLELVIGLLGIMKAGGAYVPLDASYPLDRLAFMLADAQPLVLVTALTAMQTTPELQQLLDAQVCPRLDLMDWSTLTQEATDNPVVAMRGQHLAYMIYTSGSTGTPKGAMNSHAAILNRLMWMQAEYRLTAADRVLQKTPMSFDVSVWEFFWPLLVGAQLVIARPDGHKDPAYLAEVIQTAKITTVHFVPSMLRLFLAHPQARGCRSLRLTLCSGEALPADVVAQFFAHIPLSALHNLYGPTEAAVDVSYWACAAESLTTSVPIGRPVANTQLYVLDSLLEPVPIGCFGEVYIGGVQVGRGYHHRPSLTAERFVPDPWSGEAGARLYRTGDVGRWRADGSIEYGGRIDHQVKLRGLRIELGEIEHRVLALPVVTDAVVVVREDQPGDQRLVAYVVAPHAALTLDAVRQQLAQHLPEYMLPNAVVVLERMPLSPNGKVDRRRLPAPSYESLTSDDPPQTELEQLVATIWAEVLGVPSVQRHANFFQLGGHSLLATQVVARVRDLLPTVEVPLRRLFEVPTLAAFAASLDSTPHEAAMVLPALVRQPTPEHIPLSFAQERLWFLSQLDAASSQAYTIPMAVRIVGAVPPTVVQAALQQVVDRHASLRTSFYAIDGQPYQRIAAQVRLDVPVQDVDGWSEAAVAAVLARVIAEPFDLERGPLLRAMLLREAADRHILVLTVHHTITDGQSMEILLRELAQALAAARQGAVVAFAPLAVDVVDVVVWQRAVLRGERLTRLQTYWQQQLRDVAPLALPTDYPRPAVQQFAGATVAVTIAADVVTKLRELGQAHGATLFMVLMAAYQAWLARLSGQRDIAVGTPIAGRTQAGMEGLIGFFANTLVVRSAVAWDDGFTTLLGQVRETLLAGYSHQELPFEQVVQVVQPERDLSRSPLFQTLLTVQHAQPTSLDWGAIQLEPIRLAGTIAKFDLSLGLVETPQGLVGGFEYSTALFAETTIERWASHWQTFLTALADDPALAVGSLPLLQPAEQAAIVQRQAPVMAIPGPLTLAGALARQAATTPHALALQSEGSDWTYAQLNAAANQLAWQLRALGIGPDMVVGVYLERTSRLIVAMLAIVKAGAAYLPLDPHHPIERLIWMLADSQASLVVTEAQLATRLSDQSCPVLAIDTAWSQIVADQPAYDPPPSSTPAHLAYVIYTSGSTGVPKGVVVPQQAVLAMLASLRQQLTLELGDRILALSTMAFDISVVDVFLPLTSGAMICLVSSAVARDPVLLRGVLEGQAINVLQATPATWRLLISAGWQGDPTLTAIAGGEALSVDLAAAIRARSKQLWNMYGPTETTVYATRALIENDDISLGWGLENVRLYVLDQAGQVVPLGVAGELYIGGTGVARGYLGRPSLTAERFVPDPWSGEAGARLYRTGDLVRQRADGRFDYDGRIDHQVKVRGFRIELGEIEQRLLALAEVTDAVVVVREDQPGDQRLVAYVVAAPNTLTLSTVRQRLAQHLPEYMLPNLLMLLDAFPLSPNGKVDRRRLPVPSYQHEATLAGLPRNALELQLVNLWENVLAVQPISITQNFFELGGHSMLAVRLMAEIRRELGYQSPLAALFQYPTVADLAHFLAEHNGDLAYSPLVTLKASGTKAPIFLVHPIGGNVGCYFNLVRELDPERPCYGLQAAGLDAQTIPVADIPTLARNYIAAIQAVQPQGPYILGGWSFGGLVAYEMAQQLQAQHQAIAQVLLLDSYLVEAEYVQAEPHPSQMLTQFIRDIMGLALATFEQNLESSADQSIDLQLQQLQQQLADRGLRLEFEQLQAMFNVFKTNTQAMYRYQVQPSNATVTLFQSTNSQAIEQRFGDSSSGWSRYTGDQLTIYKLTGDHFSMIHAPYVHELAAYVNQALHQLD